MRNTYTLLIFIISYNVLSMNLFAINRSNENPLKIIQIQQKFPIFPKEIDKYYYLAVRNKKMQKTSRHIGNIIGNSLAFTYTFSESANGAVEKNLLLLEKFTLGNFYNNIIDFIGFKSPLLDKNISVQSTGQLKIKNSWLKNIILPRINLLIDLQKQNSLDRPIKKIIKLKQKLIDKYSADPASRINNMTLISKMQMQIALQRKNLNKNSQILQLRSIIYKINLSKTCPAKLIETKGYFSYKTVLQSISLEKSRYKLRFPWGFLLNIPQFSLHYRLGEPGELKGQVDFKLRDISTHLTNSIRIRQKHIINAKKLYSSQLKDKIKEQANLRYKQQFQLLDNYRTELINNLSKNQDIYIKKYKSNLVNSKAYEEFIINLENLITGAIESQYKHWKNQLKYILSNSSQSVVLSLH